MVDGVNVVVGDNFGGGGDVGVRREMVCQGDCACGQDEVEGTKACGLEGPFCAGWWVVGGGELDGNEGWVSEGGGGALVRVT